MPAPGSCTPSATTPSGIDPSAPAVAGAVRADVAAAGHARRAPRVRRSVRSTCADLAAGWRAGGLGRPPGRGGQPGHPGRHPLGHPAGPGSHPAAAGRRADCTCSSPTGAVEVEAVGRLAEGDALRLSGGAQLRLTGVRAAEVLVWTMMVR